MATNKAEVVSAAKTECEALVEKIVLDKRVADEQQKQVNAEAEKIGREAAEANEISRLVHAELDRALPALRAAEEALNVLTKKDIAELKAYAKPPGLVELTLQGAARVPSVPFVLPNRGVHTHAVTLHACKPSPLDSHAAAAIDAVGRACSRHDRAEARRDVGRGQESPRRG